MTHAYTFLLGFIIGKYNRLWISPKPDYFVAGAGLGLGMALALPFIVFKFMRP